MAKSYNCCISKPLLNPCTHQSRSVTVGPMLAFSSSSASKIQAAAANKDQMSQHIKKTRRKAPLRRLITISTSDGRYQGRWNCDHVFSLRELQLEELAEDGQKDVDVFISLSVQKHAGFGFSVDGRIVTTFNRKCSCCFKPYSREIDTTFDVWVLPSNKSHESQLPEIGGNDPSVIYVKPGSEADLDSLVKDAIRLTASVKDTCSESCEKSTPIWKYTDGKKSYDQRWSKLLELKNAM